MSSMPSAKAPREEAPCVHRPGPRLSTTHVTVPHITSCWSLSAGLALFVSIMQHVIRDLLDIENAQQKVTSGPKARPKKV